jgi:hypothetical protein
MGTLDAKTDDVNLRCWDQKRRFGIDFLYPIDRYWSALTSPVVPDRTGNMVANPIYADLDPSDNDSNVRDSSLVFLAYITGVPWQDIAIDPKDSTKGYKSAAQLEEQDAMGHSAWDYIIGDPANYVAPLDPHMRESASPRAGVNPITGDTIAPPAMTEGGPDTLSGHEYTPGTQNGVQVAPDDLEYACIFKIPTPRDCSDPNVVACDCTDPLNDNPLCADNPGKGRTLQTHAKGYPGIRQLALIKELGSQGIVGSICPAQLSNLSAPDYGYRPAVRAIIDRLTPVVDGGCLPRALKPGSDGRVSCSILEVRHTGMNLSAAACDAFCAQQPGRIAVPPADAALRAAVMSNPLTAQLGADCVCELEQLGGAPSPGCAAISSELASCQCDTSLAPQLGGKAVDGWCYVDADTSPPTGNPQIVASCPAMDKRILRFVGAGQPAPGSLAFIACTGL